MDDECEVGGKIVLKDCLQDIDDRLSLKCMLTIILLVLT